METFVVTRRGQRERERKSWRNRNSRGRRGNENPVFNCNQEETQPGVITRGTCPTYLPFRGFSRAISKYAFRKWILPARIGLNRLCPRTGSRALRAEFPWMRFTGRGKSVVFRFSSARRTDDTSPTHPRTKIVGITLGSCTSSRSFKIHD